jgi:hypothetical protein
VVLCSHLFSSFLLCLVSYHEICLSLLSSVVYFLTTGSCWRLGVCRVHLQVPPMEWMLNIENITGVNFIIWTYEDSEKLDPKTISTLREYLTNRVYFHVLQ